VKRHENLSDTTRRGSTTGEVAQGSDESDVTGGNNEENTLVVETPVGDGDTPQHDDPPQSTIDAVTLLQTDIRHDDTVNDTIHPTPDMTTGYGERSAAQRRHLRCACEMVPLREY
jgi:hypothetical protein